jgi:hypothetical protein
MNSSTPVIAMFWQKFETSTDELGGNNPDSNQIGNSEAAACDWGLTH